MNKYIVTWIVVCTAFVMNGQTDQTYRAMESRFNRSAPTPEDSTAFINQGIQKAKSLFQLGDLYTSNSGRASNQSYIQTGTDQMFYVEEGDSLNTEEILERTSNAESTDGMPIRFEVIETEEYLCKITTLNCSPAFTFYLVLRRVTKKFGRREEVVWDVFLMEG